VFRKLIFLKPSGTASAPSRTKGNPYIGQDSLLSLKKGDRKGAVKGKQGKWAKPTVSKSPPKEGEIVGSVELERTPKELQRTA